MGTVVRHETEEGLAEQRRLQRLRDFKQEGEFRRKGLACDWVFRVLRHSVVDKNTAEDPLRIDLPPRTAKEFKEYLQRDENVLTFRLALRVLLEDRRVAKRLPDLPLWCRAFTEKHAGRVVA